MHYFRILFLAVASVAALLTASPRAAAQIAPGTSPDTYFPYPAVPDSMVSLNSRTNYLVHHFWDFCDLKKAFSSRPRMRQALADYLSFMPYASADTVDIYVTEFMKKIEKQPDDVLFVMDEVDGQLLSDSAQYYSEQVYLYFANAAAKNKRLDKASRARLDYLTTILGNTQPGKLRPDLTYTDRNGAQRSLDEDANGRVATILFFGDPDCSDCRMARIRLDADITATKLINSRAVKVVYLTAGDYTPEWAEAVSSYPERWTVGVNPEIDTIYHIDGSPSFYLLDNKGMIRAKNYTLEEILDVLHRLK